MRSKLDTDAMSRLRTTRNDVEAVLAVVDEMRRQMRATHVLLQEVSQTVGYIRMMDPGNSQKFPYISELLLSRAKELERYMHDPS